MSLCCIVLRQCHCTFISAPLAGYNSAWLVGGQVQGTNTKNRVINRSTLCQIIPGMLHVIGRCCNRTKLCIRKAASVIIESFKVLFPPAEQERVKICQNITNQQSSGQPLARPLSVALALAVLLAALIDP